MMLELHIVLSFLIGNTFCSEYVGIRMNIENSRVNVIGGEEKLEVEKAWNRDDPTVIPSGNETPTRLRMYCNQIFLQV